MRRTVMRIGLMGALLLGAFFVRRVQAQVIYAAVNNYGESLDDRGIFRIDFHSGESTQVCDVAFEFDSLVGNCMVAGHDGMLYVAPLDTHDIRRINLANGADLGVFAAHPELSRTYAMVVGPDGDIYASSTHGTDRNNEIFRFDGDTGEFVARYLDPEEEGAIGGMAFGPDGRLYFAYGPHCIKSLNVETGEVREFAQLPDRIDGHAFRLRGWGFAFLDDGTICVTCTLNPVGEGIARIDVSTGTLKDVVAWPEIELVPFSFSATARGEIVINDLSSLVLLDSLDAEPRRVVLNVDEFGNVPVIRAVVLDAW